MWLGFWCVQASPDPPQLPSVHCDAAMPKDVLRDGSMSEMGDLTASDDTFRIADQRFA
jgi:hypothetical protein